MIRRSTTVQFLAALAVVALYASFLVYQGPKGKEHFPVFKWELFSKVPDRQEVDYGFRIIEIDGRPLVFPRYFEQMPSTFDRARSPDVTHLSRSVGLAVKRGDERTAEDRRRRFETRFLAGHDVTFEVVERRYDTIERATCNCYTSETVLATFTYEGRSG